MNNNKTKLFERWAQLGDKDALSQGQKYIYVNEEFDWESEDMLSESDFRIDRNSNNFVELNSDMNYEYDDEIQSEVPVAKHDRMSKHYFSDIPSRIESEPELHPDSNDEEILSVIDDEDEMNNGNNLNSYNDDEPIDFDPSTSETDWNF